MIVSDPHDNWLSFPRSSIPMLPVFDRFGFTLDRSRPCDHYYNILSEKSIFTDSGRYAISLALDFLEINSQSTILIPSFHCLAMIAPVVWSGANIRFYKVKRDLSADIKDIKKKISFETKAILIVHYFGFPQDLKEIAGLCRDNGMYLIEDCAHAFFGRTGSAQIGKSGDFAIASIKKFFAVPNGGVLICNSSIPKKYTPNKLGLYEQIRNVSHSFEENLYWNYPKNNNFLFKIYDYLKSMVKVRKSPQNRTNQPEIENKDINRIGIWFNPEKRAKPISIISKLIYEHTNIHLICKKRIQNYSYLFKNLNQLNSVAPLYPTMDKDIVPYMFPLVLKHPDRDFKILKGKKIPMWRWEELCITDCSVSQYFSKHLIQIPCHQSLKKDQLDIIIKAIRDL